MTSEHRDDPAGPEHAPPQDETIADLLAAIRHLTLRIDRLERRMDRWQAGAISPGLPRPRVAAGRPAEPAHDPAAAQRHVRIADRFGERTEPPGPTAAPAAATVEEHAAMTEPQDRRAPTLGAGRSGEPRSAAEQFAADRFAAGEDAAPEPEGRAAAPGWVVPEAMPNRRLRRRGLVVLVWLLVAAAAILAGIGYAVYHNAALRARLLAQYGELLHRPADETIPVAGQSPIPEDNSLRTDRAGGGTTPPPAAPSAGAGVAPAAATPAPTAAAPAEAARPAQRPAAGPAVGPRVEAAPRSAVESEALDSNPAPLPDNAPAELRRLAEIAVGGNAEAQHDLATRYALGDGVPQDYRRAAYWYQRSADGGVVNARYNLAVLTQRGEGVPQDARRAFDLFLLAAEAGHPDARIAVGLAYMQGSGVQRDPVKAATWFQAASAAGSARGAYHLGRLFEQGLDGAPDLAAAAGWYRIAADAGDPQARTALERVTAAAVPAAPPAIQSAVPVPAGTPAPAAPAAAEVTRDTVREIQRLLTRLGYSPGPADGLMGDRTRIAIEQFQRARNLTVDGAPSATLLTVLQRAAGNG